MKPETGGTAGLQTGPVTGRTKRKNRGKQPGRPQTPETDSQRRAKRSASHNGDARGTQEKERGVTRKQQSPGRSSDVGLRILHVVN